MTKELQKSNKLQNEATIFLFKKMWKFSVGNRKNVVLYLFLCICGQIILLLPPAVFGIFLNELQDKWMTEANINFLVFLLFGSFLLSLVFWSFHWIARVLERKNAFLVEVNYKEFLFERVLNFDLWWHTERQSGDSIDKIEKSTKSLFVFSQDSFEVVGICIRAVGTIVALLFFSVWIALGVLVAMVICLFVIFSFDKRLVPLYKEKNLLENKISAKIYDSLSNITSIIILNIKKLVSKGVSESLYTPQKSFSKQVVLNENKWMVGDLLFDLITAVPVVCYVLVAYNTWSIIEVWTISALYMYLANLSRVFFGFGWLYSRLIQQKTDIENVSDIEDSEEQIQSEKEVLLAEKIDIQDAWFSYKKDEKAILQNINFSFTSWEKIAFIWESGSGKTTFLKLLHGLHDFNSGEIVINWNETFNTLSWVDLKTTLVPQEPELFTATIRENITFGLDYTDKQVEKFTNMACFSDVIEQLPNWLESKINEKWVNLSGGQKQRLALSRALLFAQNKKIILLDESTSSVDPHNEEKIYTHILDRFSEKTIISSIHKLNLLKFFDRIVMFDNGKIVWDGSFEELLKSNESFEKMWKSFREER